MAVLLIFVLGIANFALHKAVLESRHPLLGHVPRYVHLLGGRFGLIVEFAMLLGSMLMVASGSVRWAWGYGVYTAVNAFSAWLILNRKV